MSRARGVLLLGSILVAVLMAFVAWACSPQQAGSGPPGRVKDINVGPTGLHDVRNIDYAQTPPAGGPHNPVWQNCGFYDEPVRDENAVHSLEHGAVWITYQPDLPQKQIGKLRDLAQSNRFVLISPYPDLPAPVVATAWGKQLRLQSAENPDLKRFVRFYSQGPQVRVESGHSSCRGGKGNPQMIKKTERLVKELA
jgi:hypothetical protein